LGAGTHCVLHAHRKAVLVGLFAGERSLFDYERGFGGGGAHGLGPGSRVGRPRLHSGGVRRMVRAMRGSFARRALRSKWGSVRGTCRRPSRIDRLSRRLGGGTPSSASLHFLKISRYSSSARLARTARTTTVLGPKINGLLARPVRDRESAVRECQVGVDPEVGIARMALGVKEL
jgi:hypothetical protein